MDYSKGYSASYHVTRVDPSTWFDVAEIGRVESFSATRSLDSDAPEVDAADAGLDSAFPGECYARVRMTARQGGELSRVDVGTYLLEASSGESAPGGERCECSLWSVLRPAAERLLPPGWYAPAGSDGAELAAELLSEALDAPVVLEGGARPILAADYVSDSETYLEMAWALLDGWEISIDGDGTVRLRPEPTVAKDVRPRDIVGSIKVTWDLSGVPNAVRVSDGTYTAEAVNDDPSSPTSTVARGRRIDAPDTSDSDRADDETLQAYAKRRLAELSVATETAEYTREWRDDITVGDLVRLPGHDGEWKVTGQSITASCGLTVSETASREVSTYA